MNEATDDECVEQPTEGREKVAMPKLDANMKDLRVRVGIHHNIGNPPVWKRWSISFLCQRRVSYYGHIHIMEIEVYPFPLLPHGTIYVLDIRMV